MKTVREFSKKKESSSIAAVKSLITNLFAECESTAEVVSALESSVKNGILRLSATLVEV